MLSLSLSLSLLLYYCVDNYFRYQRAARLSGAEFSLVTAFVAILMIIPAASSWAQNGWAWRIPQEIREIGNIDQREGSIYVFAQIRSLDEKEGFDVAPEKKKVLVIGDLQAGDLVNILNEQDISLSSIWYGISGCGQRLRYAIDGKREARIISHPSKPDNHKATRIRKALRIRACEGRKSEFNFASR